MVKLKSAGVSRPFGSLTFGSRNSSKNECAQASSGVSRAVGVYSSRRLQSAIASGGVRGRKTYKIKKKKKREREKHGSSMIVQWLRQCFHCQRPRFDSWLGK